MQWIAFIKSSYGSNTKLFDRKEEAQEIIRYWKENVVKNDNDTVTIVLAEVKEKIEL